MPNFPHRREACSDSTNIWILCHTRARYQDDQVQWSSQLQFGPLLCRKSFSIETPNCLLKTFHGKTSFKVLYYCSFWAWSYQILISSLPNALLCTSQIEASTFPRGNTTGISTFEKFVFNSPSPVQKAVKMPHHRSLSGQVASLQTSLKYRKKPL